MRPWLTLALMISQNGWFIFVVYMGLSRFGSLKLGKDKEQPVFNNLTWFSMLFCSGIGIGLYQYGVAEPIFYYRGYGNKLFKVPWQNDDQFAQQALFITLYHWGLHAWGCYILVALTLGFVAFRWDMPMTLRMAFFPLLGGTFLQSYNRSAFKGVRLTCVALVCAPCSQMLSTAC